jgi:two-component system chemotaxis response regulator CheB
MAVKAIIIGVSIGGYDAVDAVLRLLPESSPPVLIAMHLKPGMPRLFAAQLNELKYFSAKEAETGDRLKNGQVLIAPGNKHMKIVNRNGKLSVECYPGQRTEHHVIPSADILFESAARELGQDAVGVILTGLGADGAAGLLQMRNQGAVTIGQDEATCAVYGMPKVAKNMGAVTYELPINSIAGKIISLL